MDREMSTISPQFATGQAQRGPRLRKNLAREESGSLAGSGIDATVVGERKLET
jgi:hypothetical protein